MSEPDKGNSSTSRPHKRNCKIAGCRNGIVQGGVCVSHGAKRRKCQVPGCDKNSKMGGKCSTHGPPRKKCEHEGCTNVAVKGGRCKSHGAPSRLCSFEDCHKVVVINGMCRRHAQTFIQEHGSLNPPPKPQEPSAPTSPIVCHETTLEFANPAPADAARHQDSEAQESWYHNSLVIAQNNYVVQNKLSQVIEAHNRLNASIYQQSLPVYHAGYGQYSGSGYPHHPYDYPYFNQDHEHEHQSRYYYG